MISVWSEIMSLKNDQLELGFRIYYGVCHVLALFTSNLHMESYWYRSFADNGANKDILIRANLTNKLSKRPLSYSVASEPYLPVSQNITHLNKQCRSRSVSFPWEADWSCSAMFTIFAETIKTHRSKTKKNWKN